MQVIASGDRVIHPPGEEIFGDNGLARKFVEAGVAGDRAIRQREQSEVSLHRRIDSDVAARQMAASSDLCGHGCNASGRERLAPPLVVGEEERPVPDDGSSGREAELIPAKRQLRVVEVSARIESVIPEELVHRPMEVVRAGTGHGADDTAGGEAVQRRVVA